MAPQSPSAVAFVGQCISCDTQPQKPKYREALCSAVRLAVCPRPNHHQRSTHGLPKHLSQLILWLFKGLCPCAHCICSMPLVIHTAHSLHTNPCPSECISYHSRTTLRAIPLLSDSCAQCPGNPALLHVHPRLTYIPGAVPFHLHTCRYPDPAPNSPSSSSANRTVGSGSDCR